MADRIWPLDVIPSSSRLDVLDSTGRFTSPLNGYTRTVTRPGERLRLAMGFTNLIQPYRDELLSEIVALRGGAGRVFIGDPSYVQRGSFPSTEVFSDPMMLEGTTGKSANAEIDLQSHDNVLRPARIANTGVVAGLLRQTSTPTVTQYAPYVFRVAVHAGRGTFTDLALRFGSGSFSAAYYALTGLSPGLLTAAIVAPATTLDVSLVQAVSTSAYAGDFVEIPFYSLSRCALVDNATNLLQYSDDFSNAAWTKTRSSIVSGGGPAMPDGSAGTTNVLHEDATAANNHYIEAVTTVSASELDYCFSVAVRAVNRTWVRLQMLEGGSSHEVTCFVNLSTGAVSNVSASGANFTNERAYAVALGDGWYKVSILGHKVGSSTSLTTRIYVGEGAGDVTFTGIDQNSLRIWRATLSQTSVPSRLTLTAGTADSDGTTQALAGGLYTKGWPVSTEKLLRVGDQVQIGDQLLIVTAPLRSDASGKAFLQTYPTLTSPPADNAPIIINRPMGKFYLENSENGLQSRPGTFNFSDAEIVLASAS